MYVLKDLWEGNITPADRGYRKGSPYARLVHQANESEDEFYNHLPDAGKKAYQVYCDQQAHVEDVKVRIPVKRRARSGGTVRPFQRKRRSRSILNGVKRRPSVLSDQRSQFLTELRPLVS